MPVLLAVQLSFAGCGMLDEQNAADPPPATSTSSTDPDPAAPTASAGSGEGTEQSGVDPTQGLAPGTVERPAEVGVVQYVVDGDTVDVAGAGRVRILGIDTPERGDCAFGPASSRMKDLVLGKQVQLVAAEGKPDTDRYGRLLRYVDVIGAATGGDAGMELLREGLAIARYDSRDGYGAHPREAAYIAADEQTPGDPCQYLRGDG